MKDNIACCGLDCEKCDAFIATKNNDDILRQKTAELWSNLNNIQITASMIDCTGCHSDGVKTLFCEHMCQIRKCSYDKQYKTCAECSQIEDCSILSAITSNNTQAKENLKNIST